MQISNSVTFHDGVNPGSFLFSLEMTSSVACVYSNATFLTKVATSPFCLFLSNQNVTDDGILTH